jgi:hypothetical protein
MPWFPVTMPNIKHTANSRPESVKEEKMKKKIVTMIKLSRNHDQRNKSHDECKPGQIVYPSYSRAGARLCRGALVEEK